MVLVNIKGGLGNQMFQYAACRNLVKKPILYINVQNGGNDFTKRDFELDVFPNVKYRNSTRFVVFMSNLETKYLGRLFLNFLRRLFSISIVDENNYCLEVAIQWNRVFFLNGYFQSELYFDKIKAEIRKTFAFPVWNFISNPLYHEIQRARNPVALHIRGGDYTKAINSKIHGILTKEYYENAIRVIKDLRGEIKVFVFTDDVEHSKNILGNFNEYTIASMYSEQAWQDMMFMGLCGDFIIANSTFSWWGAWLSEREEKMVVAPKNWFVDNDLNNKWKNIYPTNWILI